MAVNLLSSAPLSHNRPDILQDAPVECNRAFINRFETVLSDHILSGDKILGDVVDYAIRYECQGRGSLHVHMCIWLKTPEDVAALDRRIRADVPAEQDANGQFIEPEDPLQRRLFRSDPSTPEWQTPPA